MPMIITVKTAMIGKTFWEAGTSAGPGWPPRCSTWASTGGRRLRITGYPKTIFLLLSVKNMLGLNMLSQSILWGHTNTGIMEFWWPDIELLKHCSFTQKAWVFQPMQQRSNGSAPDGGEHCAGRGNQLAWGGRRGEQNKCQSKMEEEKWKWKQELTSESRNENVKAK